MDTDIESAKKMFNVNIFGLIEVTQAFCQALIAAKGRIVNIGSVAGHSPIPFEGMYCGTKGALQSISDTLRIEMAPFDVKVIHVSYSILKKVPSHSLFAK
jgi:1-acylglycerone phosphate reductase